MESTPQGVAEEPESRPPLWWTDPGPWAVVLGAAVAAARLAPAPTERLLGHTLSEAPGHLWMQWLIERALRSGGPLIGQQDVVIGERLWVMPLDWIDRAAALLLDPLLGPVATFNLTAAALLTLAGAATVRLSRLAGAGRWPSALAALLVMWSPALLGYLSDGRIDSAGLGWAGMLACAWIAAMRTPDLKRGLALGGWAVGVVLSGPNLIIATALAALIPTTAAAAADRRRLLPLAAAAAIAGLATAGLVGALLLTEGNDSGRLTQTSNEEQRPLVEAVTHEHIATRRLADTWIGAERLNRDVPVASAWTLPPALEDSPSTLNAATMQTVQPYAPGAWWRLSLVPWSLALLGLVAAPRRAAPWLLFAAMLQTLALGHGSSQTLPLAINGQLYYLAPAVLLDRVPGLSSFNNYGLFATFAGLAVACAAALALSALPRRWSVALSLAAASLWLVEVSRGPVPVPLAVNDMRLPPGLIDSLDPLGPGEGVVLLPLSKDLDHYLQTFHERPTPMRFRFGAAPPGGDPILADTGPALVELLSAARGTRPRPGLCERLSAEGIGAVVVMPALLPTASAAALDTAARGALGEPDWSDGQRQVYRCTAR